MDDLDEQMDALLAEERAHMPEHVLTDMDTSDPEPFVTELVAGSALFKLEGVVKINIGGRWRPFKIRAIPRIELEEAMRELKPKRLPKVLDKQTKTYVEDTESEAYLRWIGTYGYLRVLLGLADITLRNREGVIVWQYPGEVRHLAEAVQALQQTGITTDHVERFTQAINALSAQDEDEQTETLLGN
jgi:hypothetical protein